MPGTVQRLGLALGLALAPALAMAQGRAPARYRVKLDTSKGAIVIQVTRAWAPRGADRFYALVRSG